MPPQQIMVSRWYRGTADSIYQNLTLLEHERPTQVLILSGDHVYKMNYREMLDFHLSRDADMTVAAVPVPRVEASSFGILKVDARARWRISWRNPPDPPGLPGSRLFPGLHGGLYLPRPDPGGGGHQGRQEEDQQTRFRRRHHPPDGGAEKGLCLQLPRPGTARPATGGTSASWTPISRPIRTCWAPPPPSTSSTRTGPCAAGRSSYPPANSSAGACLAVGDSLIASGCIIEGTVNQVGALPRGHGGGGRGGGGRHPLGRGGDRPRGHHPPGHHRRQVRVPANFPIGADPQQDAKRFHVTEDGIVVVPNNVILEE